MGEAAQTEHSARFVALQMHADAESVSYPASVPCLQHLVNIAEAAFEDKKVYRNRDSRQPFQRKLLSSLRHVAQRVREEIRMHSATEEPPDTSSQPSNRLHNAQPLSPYEQQVKQNIRKNREHLKVLGLL